MVCSCLKTSTPVTSSNSGVESQEVNLLLMFHKVSVMIIY